MSISAFRAALAAFVLAAPPAVAHADPMDPTVVRFGQAGPDDPRPCSVDGSTMIGGITQCYADNASYQRLMMQLGNAVSVAHLSPARTIGYRHFYVGFEVTTTALGGISSDPPPTALDASQATQDAWRDWRADNYWRMGTNGTTPDASAAAQRFNTGNRQVINNLTTTRLAFRKGLPLGLEMGGSLGRVLETSLWALSFEMKWALLEGFRHRWQAILPDVALRGGITTVAGNRGFTMTVPAFGVTVSKSFVLGDTLTLTPYVTGQDVMILTDSEVIDATPGSDVDNAGDRSLITFERIREYWQPRLAVGLEVKYTRFVLNGVFRTDLGDPLANFRDARNGERQWTLDLGIGVLH